MKNLLKILGLTIIIGMSLNGNIIQETAKQINDFELIKNKSISSSEEDINKINKFIEVNKNGNNENYTEVVIDNCTVNSVEEIASYKYTLMIKESDYSDFDVVDFEKGKDSLSIGFCFMSDKQYENFLGVKKLLLKMKKTNDKKI